MLKTAPLNSQCVASFCFHSMLTLPFSADTFLLKCFKYTKDSSNIQSPSLLHCTHETLFSVPLCNGLD